MAGAVTDRSRTLATALAVIFALCTVMLAAPPARSGDGAGAAATVKMKTSFRVSAAKGNKARYTGRVKARRRVRIHRKHLPSGVSRGAAKSAAREACLRDWRSFYGSITVRRGSKTLGSDTNLTDRLKWAVKARAQAGGTSLTASGPQLFARASVNGKPFSARCSRPAKSILMP